MNILDFEISDETKLGEGAFSIVRKAKDKKTGKIYALKTVNLVD